MKHQEQVRGRETEREGERQISHVSNQPLPISHMAVMAGSWQEPSLRSNQDLSYYTQPSLHSLSLLSTILRGLEMPHLVILKSESLSWCYRYPFNLPSTAQDFEHLCTFE